jgi:hypothetical protein
MIPAALPGVEQASAADSAPHDSRVGGPWMAQRSVGARQITGDLFELGLLVSELPCSGLESVPRLI